MNNWCIEKLLFYARQAPIKPSQLIELLKVFMFFGFHKIYISIFASSSSPLGMKYINKMIMGLYENISITMMKRCCKNDLPNFNFLTENIMKI